MRDPDRQAEEDDNSENYRHTADAMVQSLRTFGHDLVMAIADLIDNTINTETATGRISVFLKSEQATDLLKTH